LNDPLSGHQFCFIVPASQLPVTMTCSPSLLIFV